MKQKPIEEGYFKIKEDGTPVLIGSYSAAADEHYFPIRKQCPITEEPVETVELPVEGTLYSWTYVYMPMMGSAKMGAAGHGVGQIDLPNGVRVQANIEGEKGDWTIGMKMKLQALPIKTVGDTELCTFGYAPA